MKPINQEEVTCENVMSFIKKRHAINKKQKNEEDKFLDRYVDSEIRDWDEEREEDWN